MADIRTTTAGDDRSTVEGDTRVLVGPTQPTISATWDALAAAIATTGLRVSTNPIEMPSPPVCIIALERIDFHAGGMGSVGVVHTWSLSVVIGRTNARGGWSDVASYLDTADVTSIRAALLADVTLGGVVTSLSVPGTSSISTVQQGTDTSFVVAELEVNTHSKGPN